MRALKTCVSTFIAALLATTGGIGVAPAAHATGCGDGTLHFSGGEGSATDPFLIASEADLVALREGWNYATSYYNCQYRQVADIAMSGVWDHGIGLSRSGLEKPFTGVYDGGGHTITNLTIDSEAAPGSEHSHELGFIGKSSGAASAVRNVGLVNVAVSCGSNSQRVGMLVGSTQGTVSGSFATGSIDCLNASTQAGGLTDIGGLVAYATGTVSNCWVSGTVTSVPGPVTFAVGTFGGGIGRASGAVTNLLSRVTVVNATPATVIWVGAFAGLINPASASGNVFLGTANPGLSSTGNLTDPVSGITAATQSELMTMSTYSSWSITQGLNSGYTWGIDPNINGGFPFLQAFYPPTANDDQAPPPILQQLPRGADGSCAGLRDAEFGYGTGLTGGWTPSWAQWSNQGRGGPVCERTLAWQHGGWRIAV